MKKNKLLLGGVVALALSLLIWSCKDEFSAEDQLRLQAELDKQAREDAEKVEKDSVALSILVYNASTTVHSNGGRTSSINGLSGITVKLAAQGTVMSATTTDEGLVNFYVQPGSLSGTLSGTGFATANFTLTVTEAEDAEGEETGEALTNASVALPVFANAGAKVATVSGRVTYEGDLLNNTREDVPNNAVSIVFNPSETDLQRYYQNVQSTGADIDHYSFEGSFITTVTDGAFSIDLPASVDGIGYYYTFNDFTADQNIAINRFENDAAGSVRAARSIPTRFTSSMPFNNFTAIPSVAPTQIDIALPPAAGSGAAATLKLVGTSIDAGFGFSVLAAGSGYPISATNIPVTVNGGDFDTTIPGAQQATLFATSDNNGRITGINTTGGPGGTLGFGYRSQATLAIGGTGSGAVVRCDFRSTVAPPYGTGNLSGTVITDGGSGYLLDTPPALTIRGFDELGNLVESTLNNIRLHDGKVVNFFPNATAFAKLSTSVFVSPSRVPATATAILNTIGDINSATMTSIGNGYSPSALPTVTVRGLRGGSGATFEPVVVANTVTALRVINRGSGYATVANANFPSGPTPASATGFASGSTLVAGQKTVVDYYYGTGIRTQAVQ